MYGCDLRLSATGALEELPPACRAALTRGEDCIGCPSLGTPFLFAPGSRSRSLWGSARWPTINGAPFSLDFPPDCHPQAHPQLFPLRSLLGPFSRSIARSADSAGQCASRVVKLSAPMKRLTVDLACGWRGRLYETLQDVSETNRYITGRHACNVAVRDTQLCMPAAYSFEGGVKHVSRLAQQRAGTAATGGAATQRVRAMELETRPDDDQRRRRRRRIKHSKTLSAILRRRL